MKKLAAALIMSLTGIFAVGCGNGQPQSTAAVKAEQTTAAEQKQTTAEAVSWMNSSAPETEIPGEDGREVQEAYLPPANTLVFRGAAMFTGMEPVTTENYEDGTYVYEDMTEDGMTVILNTAFLNNRTADNVEEYITQELEQRFEAEQVAMTSQGDYSERFTYPAYLVEWIWGANEDTTAWIGVIALADEYTYLYAFGSPVDYQSEMMDLYMEGLDNLILEEMETGDGMNPEEMSEEIGIEETPSWWGEYDGENGILNISGYDGQSFSFHLETYDGQIFEGVAAVWPEDLFQAEYMDLGFGITEDEILVYLTKAEGSPELEGFIGIYVRK